MYLIFYFDGQVLEEAPDDYCVAFVRGRRRFGFVFFVSSSTWPTDRDWLRMLLGHSCSLNARMTSRKTGICFRVV